jgi:hypothetical protein
MCSVGRDPFDDSRIFDAGNDVHCHSATAKYAWHMVNPLRWIGLSWVSTFTQQKQ